MARNRLPSKKSLRDQLMKSLFDPRESGPMKIVVELANPLYCEVKAIELIRESQAHKSQRREKLQQAISVLALALLQGSDDAEAPSDSGT